MSARGFFCAAMLSCALAAFGAPGARRHVGFSERPGKRKTEVARLREKAKNERAAACVWAARHGVPVRRRVGRQTIELMAVRDGRPIYYGTKIVNAAISLAVDKVRGSAPYDVDGSGVLVGVWDGGAVLTNHVELSGRIRLYDGPGGDDHATVVAGIVAAAGVNATVGAGMAPAAGIDSYDWDDDVSEMTLRAAATPNANDRLSLSTHSYGYLCGWEAEGSRFRWYGEGWDTNATEGLFGRYDADAADWDRIVFNAPYYLPFKAAGNDRNDDPEAGDIVYKGSSSTSYVYDPAVHPPGDGNYKAGYDTIDSLGCAKNAMTVGAVKDAVSGGSRRVSKAGMTSFSSWGPTDDGRIKPDIVANGYTVSSCTAASTNAYDNFLSGTSMAVPGACGAAALLVEYYGRSFPGQAMRASTLKGLIIHTADDLGAPGPDYRYGWGLMNVLAAAETIRDQARTGRRLYEETLLEGATDVRTFFCDGREPVKVTLCWTDPPGTPRTGDDDRTPALVDDLDLSLVGPSGETNYPYRLDYAHPDAVARTDGPNRVDNVEQVWIAAPASGRYEIRVSHAGYLKYTDRPYSLIVSGHPVDTDEDGLPDWWETQYGASSTGMTALADADGDGQSNLLEYRADTDPSDPDSLTRFVLARISGAIVLHWNSAPGRLYDVLWSDDLTRNDFAPIAQSIPFDRAALTDAVHAAASSRGFYRLDVRLEDD